MVCGMHGAHNTRVIVSLSYTSPQIDDARRAAISRNFSDIMLFSTFFHEIFMKSVIEKGIAPSFEGAPLSKRERECLVLAAHGQTTQDMAQRLE